MEFYQSKMGSDTIYLFNVFNQFSVDTKSCSHIMYFCISICFSITSSITLKHKRFN